MTSHEELIQRIPLFSMLTPKQSRTVAGAVVKATYGRGEVVIEQGKKSDKLFIILSGAAQVVSSHPDRPEHGEAILALLRPGDYIGEMSMIDNAPHSATVKATQITEMLVLGRTEFAACLPLNSSMAYAVMKGLVKRIRHANASIQSLAIMDVHGRVARALLELAHIDTDGTAIVKDPVSRQMVGKMVGATRETVSRVMTTLAERGLIELQADGSTLIHKQVRYVNDWHETGL